MMNDRLLTMLKQLRLSGLAETLEVRLQEAAGHQLSHAEFLELILQDELLVRDERLIARRVKAAAFRELKRSMSSTGRSIRRSRGSRSSTWPPAASSAKRGTCCCWARRAWAKSFLVQAIGYQAIKQGFVVLTARSSTWSATSCTTKRSAARRRCWRKYLKPDLLIVDDMGMKQLAEAKRRVPVRDHHAPLRDPQRR